MQVCQRGYTLRKGTVVTCMEGFIKQNVCKFNKPKTKCLN